MQKAGAHNFVSACFLYNFILRRHKGKPGIIGCPVRRCNVKQQSKNPDPILKQEIMLQVNQRLFDRGVIPKAVYEAAKIKIVNT